MKFRVLGSYGGDSPVCRMTSFLIDDVVTGDLKIKSFLQEIGMIERR